RHDERHVDRRPRRGDACRSRGVWRRAVEDHSLQLRSTMPSSRAQRGICSWLAAALLWTTFAQPIQAQSARPSPSWLRDGVIYELNTRDFSSAGTFNAVTDRLDTLNALGVNILWLMPIHPIGQLNKKGTIG